MRTLNVVLGTLLVVVASTPSLALNNSFRPPTGTNIGVLDPLPPGPQPPPPPSQPAIGAREATSIQIQWWDLGTTETSETIERNRNKDGNWTVIASFGPLQGFQTYTDGGLSPDTLYCYRVRARNDIGSTPSKEQCVYTKDGTGRSVVRAQIRIRTGTLSNADTEDSVAVLLNSATSLYAVPSGNRTWLDYSHDDFERGANHTYDLSLDRIGQIGDINMISIQKEGGDDWCLAEFDLLVNGQVLFRKSFASQPGGCLWVTDDTSWSNMVTVSFPELRGTPGWYAFDPVIVPAFPNPEIVSRVESIVGNAIHGTALYWGARKGTRYVDVTKVANRNALHVDLDLKASVNNARNPAVDIQFDLEVSGGCTPDGRIALDIQPVNLRVSADFGVLGDIAQFFECAVTISNPLDCIEGGVEDAVRDAFHAPGLSALVDDAGLCDDGRPHPWEVLTTGSIVLTF